jgi:lysophospholipase-2
MPPETLHTIAPTSPHTHTIIFLHGRGSSAPTFASEIFESQNSQGDFFPALLPGVKWIFPCAKTSWAQSDHEYMPQWFDMVSVQRPWEGAEAQKGGLEESAEYVAGIIDDEAKEVGREKVILAGISQGCTVGLYTLLARGKRVGGFFGLCGWFPVKEWDEVGLEGVRGMPVLVQHCRDDDVVPVEHGEDLAAQLRKMGIRVDFECFEGGGHWLNEPKGMDGIVKFVQEIMEHGETLQLDRSD